jgi:hypothetical protein
MTSWMAYCRTIALGSGGHAFTAKLCIRAGGSTPGAARKNTTRKLRDGMIDEESYRVFMSAIDDIEDMHKKGIQTHVVDTNNSMWQDMGGGCHVRRMVGVQRKW